MYLFTSVLKIMEFHSCQIPAKHCSEGEQNQNENVTVTLSSAQALRSSVTSGCSSNYPHHFPAFVTGQEQDWDTTSSFPNEFTCELNTRY